MAPQRKLFSKEIDLSRMAVTMSTATRSETYMVEKMPEEIRNMLTLYGLTQKLSDKTASAAGFLNEDEKWQAMNELYAALHRGEWAMRSEGAGTVLVRALAELSPKVPLAEIKARVDGWSTQEIKAVRANPKVAKIINRLEAERAKDIDSNALLAGLLG